MSKLKILKSFLSNPTKIIKAGYSSLEENRFKDALKSQYKLTQLPTINIMDLIPSIDEEIENYTFLGGTSMITDLLLLKSLAKQRKDCDYLEIGSWRGESLSNVSKSAKQCVSLTLGAEDMKALGMSDDFIKVHGIFSKELSNVKSIGANSHQFDFNSLNQKFDLMFIDGDHTYAGVKNDTSKTFNLRKDKNSVIVWHDYGFDSEAVRPSVLKGILDGIPTQFHKNLYHVSNTMCCVYIEKVMFETSKTTFPTYPNKKFKINITAEKIDR
jgi:predicted O-methyltransferase YrrM